LSLYYLETSALVKLYVRESGTDQMLSLMTRPGSDNFAVLSLTRIEFHAAIRKRQRVGDIEKSLANRLIRRFNQDLKTEFFKQVISDSVLDAAAGLLDQYPLRAYDAVQLAGCVVLKATPDGNDIVFVCADRQLVEAARSMGLQCLNPDE
jgi:predicted nucleic acid-binding protein